jgi:hypothetical protein
MGGYLRLRGELSKAHRSELKGNRLHFRILLQSIFAPLPSHPRLLESAERRPGIEHVVAIYPYRPRPDTVRHCVRFFDI